jgi:hypothetical protein
MTAIKAAPVFLPGWASFTAVPLLALTQSDVASNRE